MNRMSKPVKFLRTLATLSVTAVLIIKFFTRYAVSHDDLRYTIQYLGEAKIAKFTCNNFEGHNVSSFTARLHDSGVGFENGAKLLRSSKTFRSRNSNRKIVENESV